MQSGAGILKRHALYFFFAKESLPANSGFAAVKFCSQSCADARRSLRHCYVTPTPRRRHALNRERAIKLAPCEPTRRSQAKKKSSNKKEETLYATLFGIAAGILALLACGVCYMASKERKGEPLFAPKPASNPMRDDLEKA